jgi:hypothetical protein
MRLAGTRRQGEPDGAATAAEGRGGDGTRTSAGIRWVALAALPGLVISATNQYLYMRTGHGTVIESAMASASIDGIALVSGWFAHRDTKAGRNAMIPRLGLYLAAMASIYINLQHAGALHSTERGLGFAFAAAAAGSIYALELTLRAMRGDRKAATDRITARPAVLMPLGLLISAPLSTWRTHRMDVRGRHAEFHSKIRQHVKEMSIPAEEMTWVITGKAPAPEAVEHRDIPATYVLEGLTQADAIRRAIEVVGPSAREVVAWLAENGWPDVAPQRVYDVIRRDQVRAVGTGEQPVLREETAS